MGIINTPPLLCDTFNYIIVIQYSSKHVYVDGQFSYSLT